MNFGVVAITVLLLPSAALLVGIGYLLRHRTVALKESLDRYPELRRLRAMGVWSRLIGLGVGAVLCALLSAVLPLGIGLALAPLTIAVTLVSAIAIGQHVARGAVRGEGGASLTPRRVVDYYPKLGSWLVVAATLALGFFLAWTSTIASADSEGRAGRVLAYECTVEAMENGQDVSRIVTGAGSPFPGAYYSVPIGLGLIVLAVAVLAALWSIARRPRGAAALPVVHLDDVLRRQASESVLAAAAFGVASTLAGVCFIAMTRLDTSRACNAQVWGAAPFLVGMLGLVAVAIALVSVVGLVLPTSGKVDR